MGLMAPIPVVEEQTTVLPSLDPPESGHHIKTLLGGPICGAKEKSVHPWVTWNGEENCPECGKPICPTCLSMGSTVRRSGITP